MILVFLIFIGFEIMWLWCSRSLFFFLFLLGRILFLGDIMLLMLRLLKFFGLLMFIILLVVYFMVMIFMLGWLVCS